MKGNKFKTLQIPLSASGQNDTQSFTWFIVFRNLDFVDLLVLFTLLLLVCPSTIQLSRVKGFSGYIRFSYMYEKQLSRFSCRSFFPPIRLDDFAHQVYFPIYFFLPFKKRRANSCQLPKCFGIIGDGLVCWSSAHREKGIYTESHLFSFVTEIHPAGIE